MDSLKQMGFNPEKKENKKTLSLILFSSYLFLGLAGAIRFSKSVGTDFNKKSDLEKGMPKK